MRRQRQTERQFARDAPRVYFEKRLHVCRQNDRVSCATRAFDGTHGGVSQSTHGSVVDVHKALFSMREQRKETTHTHTTDGHDVRGRRSAWSRVFIAS